MQKGILKIIPTYLIQALCILNKNIYVYAINITLAAYFQTLPFTLILENHLYLNIMQTF